MATVCSRQLFLHQRRIVSPKLPFSSDLAIPRVQLSEQSRIRGSKLVLTGEFPGGSVPRASPANITPVGDDEGVSLGTMKLPMNTDIDRFETLLFQWANSLCQGAQLPLPMPLKGMADFMSEMAVMMSQNKPHENGETFEELKDLFEEMFESDIESFNSTSHSSTLFSSCGESSSSSSSKKRGSSTMSNTKNEDPLCFDAHFQGFSLGAGRRFDERSNSRRKGRHA